MDPPRVAENRRNSWSAPLPGSSEMPSPLQEPDGVLLNAS